MTDHEASKLDWQKVCDGEMMQEAWNQKWAPKYAPGEVVVAPLTAAEETAKWEGIAKAGKDADERMAMLRHSKAAQWVSDMRILCGCKGCSAFPHGHERTCVVHVLLLTKVIPRTYMDRRANKSGAV
jgi:hypothetical protein